MNKTTSARANRHHRRNLLMGVSAAALMVSANHVGDAMASEAERPTVWIEGGWQFEQVTGKDDLFLPSFFDAIDTAGFKSPARLENPMAYSYGAEGKITFQPKDSNWLFSAAIRYGRASGRKADHEEKNIIIPIYYTDHTKYQTQAYDKFTDTRTSASETHLIADFQIGKDVGLGLLSSGSTSTINFGVRFAQFRSKSNTIVAARPDFGENFVYFSFAHVSVPFTKYYNRYDASSRMQRDFKGIGPSLSWNASTPLMGSPEDGEISLDWGINGALLFGRQGVKGEHRTRDRYYLVSGIQVTKGGSVHTSTTPLARSRRVTVPNVGGFAGVSYRFVDAKLSVGYRADLFFGAMDGGIDERHAMTRGFNGPYASVSIGLGD